MFGIYAGAALLVALVVVRLSPQVEAPLLEAHGTVRTRWQRLLPPLGPSRGIILRLAALFSMDALAGGLVVQSLMVLFFHLRFGAPLAELAALFFGANTLSALSLLAAAPLARRFGLLNTMVFTHLPSNLLLALVAMMPTFPLAAAVLLARQILSQMDVPTRQAYTMALVLPEERTAAASVTSLARSAGSSSSPLMAGLLLQGPALTLGLPFVLYPCAHAPSRRSPTAPSPATASRPTSSPWRCAIMCATYDAMSSRHDRHEDVYWSMNRTRARGAPRFLRFLRDSPVRAPVSRQGQRIARKRHSPQDLLWGCKPKPPKFLSPEFRVDHTGVSGLQESHRRLCGKPLTCG